MELRRVRLDVFQAVRTGFHQDNTQSNAGQGRAPGGIGWPASVGAAGRRRTLYRARVRRRRPAWRPADQLMPGRPWPDIRGMGNRLRHAYDRVVSGGAALAIVLTVKVGVNRAEQFDIAHCFPSCDVVRSSFEDVVAHFNTPIAYEHSCTGQQFRYTTTIREQPR